MRRKLALLGILIIGFYGCKDIPPFAISGSIFTITATPSIVTVGGEAIITVMATEPSGNPVRDGTVVYFTASAGEIDSKARFKDGIAKAIFKAPNYESEVTITAQSGSIVASTTVSVVSKKVEYVLVEAHPSHLPKGGGKSKIIATVLDGSFSPIKGVPVSFSTSGGYFQGGGVAYTKNDGKAYDYLITEKTATVTVDAGGKSAETKVVVEGEGNSPPTASFEYEPQSPRSGETVVFDASSSSDPDGYIESYFWDFGDGEKNSGKVVKHVFSCDYTKNFVVTLTVKDNNGATDTEIKSITVMANQAPIADFTYSPSSPQKGETVVFDASSSSDPDGYIESYFWDFGDGEKGDGEMVSHVYSSAGEYVVKLTVKDNEGKESYKVKTISVSE